VLVAADAQADGRWATTIVDLKSSDRAQPEHVTETQLHVYALGYQELTSRRPDYVEVY